VVYVEFGYDIMSVNIMIGMRLVWGLLRPEKKAKKPVALRYRYGAWRHEASSQAVE